mmetsp:Transcript_32481/g.83507  ORF Transcript_32481/g.83507 Transcript_32481/m.83507 type:complete len:103 (+) Transcript_32481:458-766(+)
MQGGMKVTILQHVGPRRNGKVGMLACRMKLADGEKMLASVQLADGVRRVSAYFEWLKAGEQVDQRRALRTLYARRSTNTEVSGRRAPPCRMPWESHRLSAKA